MWNYGYIILVTLWSTFYLESWKRKHETLSYIWGLNERKEQIERSVKLPQTNTEYVFNQMKGKREKVVLNERKCCIYV